MFSTLGLWVRIGVGKFSFLSPGPGLAKAFKSPTLAPPLSKKWKSYLPTSSHPTDRRMSARATRSRRKRFRPKTRFMDISLYHTMLHEPERETIIESMECREKRNRITRIRQMYEQRLSPVIATPGTTPTRMTTSVDPAVTFLATTCSSMKSSRKKWASAIILVFAFVIVGCGPRLHDL